MTPTKLYDLLIAEVSGVDDPANEIPGWMVAKARGDGARVARATDEVLSCVSSGAGLDEAAAELSIAISEVAKSGRTFSAANAELLRRAAAALQELIDAAEPAAARKAVTPAAPVPTVRDVNHAGLAVRAAFLNRLGAKAAVHKHVERARPQPDGPIALLVRERLAGRTVSLQCRR